MRKTTLSLAVLCSSFSFAQEDIVTEDLELIISGDTEIREASMVDYEAYMTLVTDVQAHRQERLVTLEEFNEMSKGENTIILDARSKAMYDAKHIKGAIHLNFSEFTQAELEALIPSTETRVLIYCNNNFEDDQIYFPTKMYIPPPTSYNEPLGITMALNIPTYINLYGYGYKNVYELKELISVFDSSVEFEGTEVPVIEDQGSIEE